MTYRIENFREDIILIDTQILTLKDPLDNRKRLCSAISAFMDDVDNFTMPEDIEFVLQTGLDKLKEINNG